MPAITAIQGFALREERAPPPGANWDLRVDRQHATTGFLLPRTPGTAKMGKSMSMTQELAGLSRHPTEPGPQQTRYTSVTDLAKAPPSQLSHKIPPWYSPYPPIAHAGSRDSISLTGTIYSRPATPSPAIRVGLVTSQPEIAPGIKYMPPTTVRRAAETVSGYSGVPVYDGAAGRASGLLMITRRSAARNTQLAMAS